MKKDNSIFKILIILFFLFTILSSNQNNKIEKKADETQVQVNNFTKKELIFMPNNPRINDTFESALQYEKKINDSKLRALTSREYAQLNWGNSSPNQGATIYLIKDVMESDSIGEFVINLNGENITLNEGIDIIRQYAPANFVTHYKKDRSFITDDGEYKIYHYATRLNAKGEKLRKNNARLSYYLSFYIVNESGKITKIYSDYSAFGNKGIDWINKYAKNWNIDLNN